MISARAVRLAATPELALKTTKRQELEATACKNSQSTLKYRKSLLQLRALHVASLARVRSIRTRLV